MPENVTTLNWSSFGVEQASNKLSFFQLLEGQEYTPPFWTSMEDIPDDQFPIVCRTVLNGHSGSGIFIANTRSELVPAPLYVKYIKKKDEYRVHIGTYNDGSGNVEFVTIATQQKKRKLEHENPNWQIRNCDNGFIYARDNVDPPLSVIDCAMDSFRNLHLDFAALDVIWNEKQGKAYVLEANTAPGLEGQTLQDYVDYFNGRK